MTRVLHVRVSDQLGDMLEYYAKCLGVQLSDFLRDILDRATDDDILAAATWEDVSSAGVVATHLHGQNFGDWEVRSARKRVKIWVCPDGESSLKELTPEGLRVWKEVPA